MRLPMYSGLVLLMVLACNGASIPIEYGPNTWPDSMNHKVVRATCNILFTSNTPIGNIKVNVTFDSQVVDFQDHQNAQRLSEDQGYWYYSQSNSHYNPDQVWDYVFFVHFDGATPPSGVCETSMGLAVAPSTTPSTTPPTTPSTTPPIQVPTTRPGPVILALGKSGTQSSVMYSNVRLHDGLLMARGECSFLIDREVPRWDFKVNVTFDSPVSKFEDHNTLLRVSQNPGHWYFGRADTQLHKGQVLTYAFDIHYAVNQPPNAMCVSNGAATVLVPSFPPSQTVTGAPVVQQKGASLGCSTPIVYWHKVLHQGEQLSRGECTFTFTNDVNVGDLKVNVTFDSTISYFDDLNTMDVISKTDGHWYYGKSNSPHTTNETWGYTFEVYWQNGDFPTGICHSSYGC